MKISRRKLRTLIESVMAESTGSGRKSFHRSQAKKISNKDKNKAEKIMHQIEGADWNAGYEVEIVMQDERATGPGSLTPIGQAVNFIAPGPDTKYGVQITGFSQQKEADQFAEVVRQKLNIRAVSISDSMLVIVDPSGSVGSTHGYSDGSGQMGTSGGSRPYIP